MKIRNAVLVLFIFSFSLHFVFAATPSRFEVRPVTSNFDASQMQVQQAANEPNISVDSPKFSNRGDNPAFIVPTPAPGPKKINTIKTLVPYEDLYKVLQQDIGKYFILPIEEFEELKKVKEAWLASQSKPVVAPPPLLYQINSARLEGRLLENFARFDAYFKIETHTDTWHEIPVFWGSIAVESVYLNGNLTTLKTNWVDNSTRQMNFGKLSKQNLLQNYFNSSMSSSDMLSQNNWKDTVFSLPVNGKGSHECRISFMVPVQNNDDLYNLQFSMAQIPLAFFRLEAEKFTLSIDSTSFKDFSVEEAAQADHSCTFIGWLGANSDVSLKWRRKYTRTISKPQPVKEPDQAQESIASETVRSEEIKPVVAPLLYARSNTLISLDETAVYGFKTIDYSISKAPVSSFSFLLPDNVEITSVNADRPHSYRQIREGNSRKLRVEFMAGREDTCQIEILYEAPLDSSQSLTGIPEIIPLGIERELGAIAVEALTSVEVQPGNDEKNPLLSGIYSLDPLEAPQPLKDRATRPILLAFRQNIRSSNILLKIKRYQDVSQQTVVADRMEVKTNFTTNKSASIMVNMRIRNNNKQYLQLQLASGTEVVSALRNNKSVKLVASRNDGKVQIPLEMSQTVGKPVDMSLQIMLKQPVEEIKWKGSLEFMPPLVDIPVSRLDWQIFAPEQYHLYNFTGTVKDNQTRKDPFFFRGFLQLLRIAWKLASSPDTLIALLFIAFMLLLIVARKLLWKIVVTIWEIISGIFSYIFSGRGFRLAELMIVFTIVGILAAISVPNFRKAREQSRHKACYANMRVILGAVEMYNMDHEQMMNSLNLKMLTDGKYLKSEIIGPEQGCRYESRGSLSGSGYIVCRLHGAVESDEELRERDAVIRSERMADAPSAADEDMQMVRRKGESAGSPVPLSQKGFGAVAVKGALPINNRFVMTSNHYSLERDLVIADIASDGALLPNRTCPQVRFNYVWVSMLNAGEIVALVLSLFAGLYFISGAFMNYPGKISFAALIIVFLSVIDLQLKSIGTMANLGFWLAIAGGIVWKIAWIVTKLNIKFSDSDDPDDSNPKKPEIKTRPILDPEEQTNATAGNDAGNASIFVLVSILLIFLLAGPLLASSELAREIRVMAPFKELEKVVPAGDRVVIIPEKDYEYLRSIVEIAPPVLRAPQTHIYENVTYKGTVEDKGVRFKATFNLKIFNEGWKEIALLTTAAVPSSASIDDRPLALTTLSYNHFNAYGFMTDATGTRRIDLEFFVPLSSSEFKHTSKFNLQMIPVCMSNLEITVNEGDCEAWIDPGVLQPAIKSDGKTVFKALLPPTTNLSFELYRNVTSNQIAVNDKPEVEPDPTLEPATTIIEEKTRVTSRELCLLYFKEGFVSGTTVFDLKFKGGSGVASLTFNIPEKIRILKVENKLIEDWKLIEEDNQRRLDVLFKSKIRGSTELVIEFEQEIQNLKNEDYAVPEISLVDAEQSYGILGIGCLQTLELSINTSPQGYSPIIAAEFLNEWKRSFPEKTPYAFKFLRHPNSLILTISRPEDISQQTAVIDKAEALTLLNEDGYLMTRVVYEVRNNSQQFLKVKLPNIGGKAAELWSTQVAGESVRAGFDEVFQAYNLPIVRSQIEAGESRSFPVEIVYVIKTEQVLQAFNRVYIELPSAHLPISELSWILYLPEGYELMREKGNVDRSMALVQTKFLNDSSYFAKAVSQKTKISQVQQIRQYSKKALINESQPQDRVFGSSGLLPVKFNIPTTSWSTSFTMLQIEPEGKAPYIEANLVNPRKGRGFFFQAFMIFIGILATIGLINMFTGENRYRWFLFLLLQIIIVAITVYLKLYQADHFAQLGFATSFSLYVLYRFFSWKPADEADQ